MTLECDCGPRPRSAATLASIQQAIDKVSHELDRQQATVAPAPLGAGPRPGVQPVQVVAAEPTDLQRLRMVIEPVFEPLATAIIVLVLTGFMLQQREDLRNRFIRLVGEGRISVTTRTMDEAGQRISQFLATQTAINAVFGLAITAGLILIGLPYSVPPPTPQHTVRTGAALPSEPIPQGRTAANARA